MAETQGRCPVDGAFHDPRCSYCRAFFFEAVQATEREYYERHVAREEKAGAPLFRCRANIDGECDWFACPQLLDNEPEKSGRHCPLDARPEDDDPSSE